tara:strand:+ start:272 stop:877 length:606 start_codon:yes stop_codon:yes gene_type:complete
MGMNTIGRQSWTLTVVRDFKSSLDEDIEWEKFCYGRTSDELENEDRKPAFLPSGLVYLLSRANLTAEALETGFVTELCSYPRKGSDWVCFERIVISSIFSPFGPTVARYVVENGIDSIEVVELSCSGESLPTKLWLRVIELDSNVIAWLIESELSIGQHKGQSTLDDWSEIGQVTRNSRIKPWEKKQLPLPGPPTEPYKFR